MAYFTRWICRLDLPWPERHALDDQPQRGRVLSLSLSRTTSSRRRSVRCCAVGSPSSIHPILFKHVFDSKPFSNQIRKVGAGNLHPTAHSTPGQTPPQHSPALLLFAPRTCFRRLPHRCRPKLGSRLAVPPAGLGLDATEDDATLPKPEAGPRQPQARRVQDQPQAGHDQPESDQRS